MTTNTSMFERQLKTLGLNLLPLEKAYSCLEMTQFLTRFLGAFHENRKLFRDRGNTYPILEKLYKPFNCYHENRIMKRSTISILFRKGTQSVIEGRSCSHIKARP